MTSSNTNTARLLSLAGFVCGSAGAVALAAFNARFAGQGALDGWDGAMRIVINLSAEGAAFVLLNLAAEYFRHTHKREQGKGVLVALVGGVALVWCVFQSAGAVAQTGYDATAKAIRAGETYASALTTIQANADFVQRGNVLNQDQAAAQGEAETARKSGRTWNEIAEDERAEHWGEGFMFAIPAYFLAVIVASVARPPAAKRTTKKTRKPKASVTKLHAVK